MADYRVADVVEAVQAVGVKPDDIVFSHAALWKLGEARNGNPGKTVLGGLSRALGKNSAIVVPAFTYSIARGETFNPSDPPNEDMGSLSRSVFQRPGTVRLHDPLFSVVKLGPRDLFHNVATSDSFGNVSWWARLLHLDGIIVNFGLDAGSTFIHYCEREQGAPYRRGRLFGGQARIDGEVRDVRCWYYSRDLDDPAAEPDFSKFDKLARERGLAKVAKLGRGEVVGIRARDTYDLIAEVLPHDPEFLVKGEASCQPT